MCWQKWLLTAPHIGTAFTNDGKRRVWLKNACTCLSPSGLLAWKCLGKSIQEMTYYQASKGKMASRLTDHHLGKKESCMQVDLGTFQSLLYTHDSLAKPTPRSCWMHSEKQGHGAIPKWKLLPSSSTKLGFVTMTKSTWMAVQACAFCYAWWQDTRPCSLTLCVAKYWVYAIKQTRDGFNLSFKTLIKDEFVSFGYT